MRIDEYLAAITPPFVVVEHGSENLAVLARRWRDSGLLVRAIRGRKCPTLDSLFDEFSAAFQFPQHFGENWPAFRDCMSDLEWLPFKSGIVVLFYDAGRALEEAHPAELPALVAALSETAAEFAEEVSDGEWWDRSPVPFHVVLQDAGHGDIERWREAGAVLVSVS